jgi:uncharacterized metal-binding protein
MPSSNGHDLATILALPPTFAFVWTVTENPMLAGVVTAMTLFGGLMFGPDLDTHSRQYTRWGIFRFLWLPYKAAFAHRSRWSHGIIFSTPIRVLYFTGVLALFVALGVYLRAAIVAGDFAPSWNEIIQNGQTIHTALNIHIGNHFIWAALTGLWWGATIHTLVDVGWSILRKAI